MIKKIIFTFIVTFVFSVQPILAQKKACKSADIAYERKQYNTAIERYKKALKKNSKKKNEDTKNYITYQTICNQVYCNLLRKSRCVTFISA